MRHYSALRDATVNGHSDITCVVFCTKLLVKGLITLKCLRYLNIHEDFSGVLHELNCSDLY